MKKCANCGAEGTVTKKIHERHPYLEGGLENVVLFNVPHYACSACGRTWVQIQAMGQLHRTLAEMLAQKPGQLEPAEMRFLRTYLDLTNAELARLMGVTESQVSRWGNSEPMGAPAERLLRILATLGPDAVSSARESGSEGGDVINMMERLTDALKRAGEDRKGPARIELQSGRAGWRLSSAR